MLNKITVMYANLAEWDQNWKLNVVCNWLISTKLDQLQKSKKSKNILSGAMPTSILEKDVNNLKYCKIQRGTKTYTASKDNRANKLVTN